MASSAATRSGPVYTVQLDIKGCSFDVRVNDGLALKSLKGLPLVTELPVNRWIRNGGNELSLHLRPSPNQTALGPEAKCSAVVYTRDQAEEREARREVARREFPKSPATRREGDETIVVSPFPAAVPFGLFRWFTAPEIADNENTLAELMAELQKYHGLFAAKNMNALLEAVRERDREDAMANYLPLADQVANSRREYSLFFDESKYELRPLITKNVRLGLYGNRRLARVELLSNGQPPLYYLAADHRTAGYLQMMFCRGAEGKWVIIR
jgi:hypothetical protein